jgi:hypothetical protein
MKRRLATAALAALLFGARAQAAVGPGPNAGLRSIQVRDGRLSADVDAPLDEVLAAIARATGLEIRVHGATGERTTFAFRDVPLEVALRHVLGATSFAFVYALPPSHRTSLPMLVAVHVYAPARPKAAVAANPGGSAAAATTAAGIQGDDPARVLLESESWVARKKAVRELATTSGDGAVDALGRAVYDDEDPWVREKAVRALGRMSSEKAITPLSDALLRDQDPFVREAAATSLGESRSETAIAMLAYALRADQGVEVREAAAAALGETRSETAAATLAEAAERDDSERVRTRALAALRSIRGGHESPADGSLD